MAEVKKKHSGKSIAVLTKDENGNEPTAERVSVTVVATFFSYHLPQWPFSHCPFLLLFCRQIVVGKLDNAKPFTCPKTVYCMGDVFKGKCTDTRAGKNRFGGWSDTSMTEYKKLIKINKKARATPASKEIETAAMNYMRTKNGITANSLEEHERQKRRKTGTREETEDEARMLFDSDGEE